MEYIDQSCPADLEPYEQAYKLEQKQNDTFAWMYCGNYVLSAVAVALEHCLSGRKAKSTYVKEPILNKIEEKIKENIPLTEEEKKKQTEALFLKLKIMGANFKNNQRDSGGS